MIRYLFSQPQARAPRPALFLDRDGVINRRIAGSYVTRWNEFEFLPGIVEALAALSEAGAYPIIVVSNQAGVGKGLISRPGLAGITSSFVDSLRRAGVPIDAVYYCPHTVEQRCDCRKPRPGLLTRAAAEWNLDLRRSVLVGDSLSDIAAASAACCRAVWLDHSSRTSRFPQAVAAVDTVTAIPRAVFELGIV
jgi:D-glycero-D-manno-heptose 1,7-bisphosphate phosphatase